MKATISLIALAIVALTGCAMPGRTVEDFRAQPAKKISETRVTVAVPAAAAYRNILAKARECWPRENRVVENDPFDKDVGYARISQRVVAGLTHSAMYLSIIDIFPETDKTSRLLIQGINNSLPMPGQADLPNIPQWAEGKDIPCA